MYYLAKLQKMDHYETPLEAWRLVDRHIRHKGIVWCPFYCSGKLRWDYPHIVHQKRDFFRYQPARWDCIIDNPPYSIKEKIIRRCIALGKPFALLLPIDTLERQYFREVFEQMKGDFTLIIPDKRINFIEQGKPTSNVAFKACWFCFGFKLNKFFIFADNTKI